MSDNKGFTLIELIISITISALIFIAVSSFLRQSIIYYRRSNEDVSLQMEAQIILNQLIDLIEEANHVDFDANWELSVLKIQHSMDLLYEIIHNSSDNTINFVKAIRIADGSISRTSPQLFGQFVEDFQVVEDSYGNQSVVKISFTLRGKFTSYEVKDSVIQLRNQIKPMQPYW